MCHQQSLGPCGCPTVPGMSHLAKYLKAPTCQKASARQQLPRKQQLGPAKLHFPAGAAAHALRRTGTLPCAEWGLCVASGSGNTAWSIPWHGTCRAGLQKHDTYSEACCFCLALLPFTYQPPLPLPAGPGSLPSFLPTSHFKERDFPRSLLHLPLSFVG